VLQIRELSIHVTILARSRSEPEKGLANLSFAVQGYFAS
jgi:hypothetical protein